MLLASDLIQYITYFPQRHIYNKPVEQVPKISVSFTV